MPRHILDESKIHPPIRERIATRHEPMVQEVQDALVAHSVVAVGMRQSVTARSVSPSMAGVRDR
jgi:monothiol glutaredoxin